MASGTQSGVPTNVYEVEELARDADDVDPSIA